jgi:hypothetical protein
VAHWGVPIDRGWLCEATDYCFPIPPASAELALRYGLLTPWEKVTVQLLDATGTPALPPAATATERWQTSWLDWKVPVPAGAQGQVWRFRQTPAGSAIVRIAGIGPLVSLAPEAAFVPARVPPPLAVAAADAPANWREPVTTIEAGKSFTVPRGPATGDGAYRHLNAREGTLEFWLRADTTDDSMDNLTFLRCGRLQFWRRTQLGTYFNLGDGFLQSGFVIRPRVWYHVALTWHLGDAQRQPVMNLFIDGVPMLSVMQTPLPEKMADWTGDSLVFGTSEPLRLTGLRIAAVARDAELRAGRLSPPPDAQTLFWQHTAARP